MEISIDYDIELLPDFSVCKFQDKYHSKDSPPHYYIIIPTRSNLYLVICMITSQIEKKISYYQKSNKKCLPGLVVLGERELPFLEKKSVIDCNRANYILKKDLCKRIIPKSYKFISEGIPVELRNRIIKAIKDSPVIKPYVKTNLDPI